MAFWSWALPAALALELALSKLRQSDAEVPALEWRQFIRALLPDICRSRMGIWSARSKDNAPCHHQAAICDSRISTFQSANFALFDVTNRREVHHFHLATLRCKLPTFQLGSSSNFDLPAAFLKTKFQEKFLNQKILHLSARRIRPCYFPLLSVKLTKSITHDSRAGGVRR